MMVLMPKRFGITRFAITRSMGPASNAFYGCAPLQATATAYPPPVRTFANNPGCSTHHPLPALLAPIEPPRSTLLTFSANASGLNGFLMNSIPESITPWREITSAV